MIFFEIREHRVEKYFSLFVRLERIILSHSFVVIGFTMKCIDLRTLEYCINPSFILLRCYYQHVTACARTWSGKSFIYKMGSDRNML